MDRAAKNSSGKKSLELKIDSINYLKIFSIINKYGGSARLVGGVVRDALLGISCKDIDIATDLLPGRVEEIFQKERFKVVPTGKSFGTISVFIYIPKIDKFESFEITTLRKDLRCDGRKAYVEYCDDYFEDAKRRDFTINAISYDPSQQKLYDYFDGAEDLNNRRVRFIGEASQRIKEDYLRILRYFRFLSRFSVIDEDNPYQISVDAESLSACSAHAEGLQSLSKERIKSEMDLILRTKNAPYILQLMIDQGIWPHIFNYSNRDFKSSDILTLNQISERFRKENFGFEIEVSSYYAVMFAAITLKQLRSLKFSSKEVKLIEDLLQSRQTFLAESKKDTKSATRYLQSYLTRKWLEDSNYQQFFMFACLCLYESNDSIEDAFKFISGIYKELQTYLSVEGQRPQFPLRSSALIEMGFAGPALGAILGKLKDIWIDSNFMITKENLLEEAKKNL